MPRSPLGPSSVKDLTPRERQVYVALRPFLNKDRPFAPLKLATRLGMTRSLLNCYLTRLWRSKIIVRIERGRYVWPHDPRAAGAPEPTIPEKLLPKEIRKKLAEPLVVPGVTLSMLMGGRARGRRRVP